MASDNPVWSSDRGKIYQLDVLKLLELMDNNSVDLIVTDLPYSSLEKWRALGTTTRLKHSKGSSNDWFDTFSNEKLDYLFVQFYRVLKPGSHLYMFCDEETRDLICTGYAPKTGERLCGVPLADAGFKYWVSLVWDKIIPGMGYRYRSQHEFIILAEKVVAKGKHRQIKDHSLGDVLPFKRLKGKAYFPTQKPIELIKLFIEQSSDENDLIVDPFCGSGSTGVACSELNRYFILGDISQRAIDYTIRKLEANSSSTRSKLPLE